MEKLIMHVASRPKMHYTMLLELLTSPLFFGVVCRTRHHDEKKKDK